MLGFIIILVLLFGGRNGVQVRSILKNLCQVSVKKFISIHLIGVLRMTIHIQSSRGREMKTY